MSPNPMKAPFAAPTPRTVRAPGNAKRRTALLSVALVAALVVPTLMPAATVAAAAAAAAKKSARFESVRSEYVLPRGGGPVREHAHLLSRAMDNNWKYHKAKIAIQKSNGSGWVTIQNPRITRWGWFDFSVSQPGRYRIRYGGCNHFKPQFHYFIVRGPGGGAPQDARLEPSFSARSFTAPGEWPDVFAFGVVASPLDPTLFEGASVVIRHEWSNDGETWNPYEEDSFPFADNPDTGLFGAGAATAQSSVFLNWEHNGKKLWRIRYVWPGNGKTKPSSGYSVPVLNPNFDPDFGKSDAGMSVDEVLDLAAPEPRGSGYGYPVRLWVDADMDRESFSDGGRVKFYVEYALEDDDWSQLADLNTAPYAGGWLFDGAGEIKPGPDYNFYLDSTVHGHIRKIRIRADWTGGGLTRPGSFYGDEISNPFFVQAKSAPDCTAGALSTQVGGQPTLAFSVTGGRPAHEFEGAKVTLTRQWSNDGSTWTDFGAPEQHDIRTRPRPDGAGDFIGAATTVTLDETTKDKRFWRLRFDWPGNRYTHAQSGTSHVLENQGYQEPADTRPTMLFYGYLDDAVNIFRPDDILDHRVTATWNLSVGTGVNMLAGGTIKATIQGFSDADGEWQDILTKTYVYTGAQPAIITQGTELFAAVDGDGARYSKLRVASEWSGNSNFKPASHESAPVSIPWPPKPGFNGSVESFREIGWGEGTTRLEAVIVADAPLFTLGPGTIWLWRDDGEFFQDYYMSVANITPVPHGGKYAYKAVFDVPTSYISWNTFMVSLEFLGNDYWDITYIYSDWKSFD